MSRKTPEWIGKTDDTSAPPRVRLRVFEAHSGKCYLTGLKITPADKWEMDHKIALINGGENREDNLAPALVKAHRQKTNQDVKIKARDTRIRQKHIGITKTKSSFSTSRSGKYKAKVGSGIEIR